MGLLLTGSSWGRVFLPEISIQSSALPAELAPVSARILIEKPGIHAAG